MAYIHCVSVLDSFPMYNARARLGHPPHLQRSMQKTEKFVRNYDKKALLNPKWIEQEAEVDTPEQAYVWRAQAVVTKLTFQSHKVINRYFSTMLTTQNEWPLQELEELIKTRNALVHRNGVTESLEPVYISQSSVQIAIGAVRKFITVAAETLLQEDGLYRL